MSENSRINEASDALGLSVLHDRMTYSFANRHGVLITHENADHEKPAEWKLFYHKHSNPAALTEIRRHLHDAPEAMLLDKASFDEMLSNYFHQDVAGAKQAIQDIDEDLDLAKLAEEIPETEDLLEAEDDAPIIRLINALLTEAIKEGASDIHVETYEKNLVIRTRVDGILREILKPDRKLAPLLISRIKVMAKLDIAEKRVPQDGRIAVRVGGRAVDVRVSTIPSSYGERAVLRLLDKQAGRLTLNQLGMQESIQTELEKLLLKPHGILLVTGPTGAGKSTTLYAGLQKLNDSSRNILTVEDPIEYQIDGIGQTQVNPKVEMTFARGLRAILRQDPDVVMVGEIRDRETAEIAVQASLTGHLVLSTLHTNTAVGAITRLVDMGVEPFLLSSSLIGVLSQRLVRKLCPHCRESYTASIQDCEMLGADWENPPTLYRAKGCEACNGQGYRGRQGIYELVIIDESIRHLVHDLSSEQAIEMACRKRTPSIRDDGIRAVLAGETTLEEVMRVTRLKD